jgi:hypothetical protein
MVGRHRVFITCCIIIIIFSFSSLVTLPVASAQGVASYGLGAGVGDWADYKIDEFSKSYSGNYSIPFHVGDTIKVTIDSLGNYSICDKNNRTVISWVVPSTTCQINGYTQTTIQSVIYAGLPIPSYSGVSWTVLQSCTPFSPKGDDFWKAVAPYTTDLQTNFTQDEVDLALIAHEHYSTSSLGSTDETYFKSNCSAEIDNSTGVMLAYGESSDFMDYSNYSGETSNISLSNSIHMTLDSTSVPLVPPGSQLVVDPALLVSVMIVDVLAVCVLAGLSRRRRHSGAMTKTETLRRLSDDELMKLAKAVASGQIDQKMERESLIRVLGKSLSLQEIRDRLKSG